MKYKFLFFDSDDFCRIVDCGDLKEIYYHKDQKYCELIFSDHVQSVSIDIFDFKEFIKFIEKEDSGIFKFEDWIRTCG